MGFCFINTFQPLIHLFIASDLTAHLEELQNAGNEAAATVNVEGDSVASRLANVRPRVNEVALYDIGYGAALALAAAQAHTGEDMSALDLSVAEISDAM